jgi:hypothetical protein
MGIVSFLTARLLDSRHPQAWVRARAASRYDFTVSTYRATARRLRDQANNPPVNPQPGTAHWSAYVNGCESIRQEQNNSWVARFGKPS